MIWLLLLPFAAIACVILVEIAADWLMACKRRLVAPERDADPCENKARKKVRFP